MALNRPQLEVVAKLLRVGALERAGKILDRLHPAEVAELVGGFGPAEQKSLVEMLFSSRRAGRTLHNVPEHVLRPLLERLDDARLGRLVENLSVDDAVFFLNLLPEERIGVVCEKLDPVQREQVTKSLQYPPTAAGRIMTTDYLAISQEALAQEAIDLIRRRAEETESVSYLYAVDDEGHLKGVVPFWRLVAARADRKLVGFMDPEPLSISVKDDQEIAADLAARHGLLSLPVLDEERRLVGVITIDDIVDIVQDEATEDIQKLGGTEALDAPYLEIGILKMIKKRGGWLSALFLGEMLTATAMGFFEGEIARAVVLSLFIPLIISSGGNSGSQATTLVIRAMALGEVRLRDWARVVRRELISGLALGSLLGTIGFTRILVWQAAGNVYGPHFMLIAVTIFFSLVGVVLFGTVAGSMLPFVLRRLGLDPASASAPFVATLVDVTGLVIYFSVASVVLRGTLL